MEQDPSRPVDYEALVADIRAAYEAAQHSSDRDLREVKDFGSRVPNAEEFPQYTFRLGEVTGRRNVLSELGAMLMQADSPNFSEQLAAFLAEGTEQETNGMAEGEAETPEGGLQPDN